MSGLGEKIPMPAGFPEAPDRDAFTYLLPGNLVASRDPIVVTTILGSCVAVCLYDATSGIGGINHFLLPKWPAATGGTPRHGSIAIPKLVERLLALGANRGRLEAKVFGGAAVLQQLARAVYHLGAQNADVAIQILDRAGIPIVANDTGGHRGRKLIFHTEGGLAFVKYL
ncbi:MAG TPA: chemotaxis protein CheD [Thermoanaerobaculia bacterium]|nr:chemotaxis protein CheD [Thermoanaerobaculia bacterium]